MYLLRKMIISLKLTLLEIAIKKTFWILEVLMCNF